MRRGAGLFGFGVMDSYMNVPRYLLGSFLILLLGTSRDSQMLLVTAGVNGADTLGATAILPGSTPGACLIHLKAGGGKLAEASWYAY